MLGLELAALAPVALVADICDATDAVLRAARAEPARPDSLQQPLDCLDARIAAGLGEGVQLCLTPQST